MYMYHKFTYSLCGEATWCRCECVTARVFLPADETVTSSSDDRSTCTHYTTENILKSQVKPHGARVHAETKSEMTRTCFLTEHLTQEKKRSPAPSLYILCMNNNMQ